jgi:ATP-dependent protease HslVU (ClpYQ) peptidase subunit
MTCILGIEHAGGVTMAADSFCGGSVVLSLPDAHSKLIVGRQHMFAVAGLNRVCDVLRHAVEINYDMSGVNLDAYIALNLATTLREALEKHCPEAAKTPTEDNNWSVLFAIRGALYWIDSSYNATRFRDGYVALGSGGQVAMGALHATKHHGGDPEDRARHALDAAAEHATGVRRPFIVHTMAP